MKVVQAMLRNSSITITVDTRTSVLPQFAHEAADDGTDGATPCEGPRHFPPDSAWGWIVRGSSGLPVAPEGTST
jgi:hypothetical protein